MFSLLLNDLISGFIFDLVDHKSLLNKLEIYGIKDEALLWFNTYLTNRKQQVKINNSNSDFKHISCGVPQGSILGPLLFLLFINDLPLCTNDVFTDFYADNTTLYDVQHFRLRTTFKLL